jgi:acyl-CoA synthetase (AMP-forming)/AMP-acid ligase II
MEKEKATGFAGVPSTFAILLRRSNMQARSLPDLRYVTQAGGAMAPALIRELQSTLQNTRIFIMYGQTEASARLSCLLPELLDEKIGSIGKGIPGVKLEVLGEGGVGVKPGEVGEIVAKGPSIMKGYWNSPEETKEVLDERGLRTGDLARVDEEGFIYIVGRKKDMIKSGAHRVNAKEIEEVILEDPSVLECAVIGVKDEMMGEAIKAFVVPVEKGRIDEERLIRLCKGRLPPYKVPKHVEIVRSMPRTEAGKIVKGLLKDRHSREGGNPVASGI